MRNEKFAILFVSIYLLIFTIITQTGSILFLCFLMFSISPFLLIWMVYTVLKYGKDPGKSLGVQDEWGYADKDKDQLNTF